MQSVKFVAQGSTQCLMYKAVFIHSKLATSGEPSTFMWAISLPNWIIPDNVSLQGEPYFNQSLLQNSYKARKTGKNEHGIELPLQFRRIVPTGYSNDWLLQQIKKQTKKLH